MLVWNLTDDNDLEATSANTIAMSNKLKALRIRIDAALQVIKGELDNSDLGVDYFGIIMSDTPLSIKVQEICRVINLIDEVADVKFVRAETDAKNHKLTFFFTITSVYGEFTYSNTFDNIE